MNELEKFLQAIETSITKNYFIKMSLGNYKGSVVDLKNIYIKKIIIKSEEKLSFTYRYQTKDIVKNYNKAETITVLNELINEKGFRIVNLFTTEKDFILEHIKNTNWKITEKNAAIVSLPDLNHDIKKNRKITAENKPYLTALNITDAQGNVLKNAHDKFKQINHYIEILSSLLIDLPADKILNIVDMGAGKGYLTFALYDYLNNTLHKNAHITGVEFRKDMVDLCNGIAIKSDFKNLKFVQSTITEFETDSIDFLIALHACDTATDDAIAKGIKANAHLIVTAPCCHQQIRKEIEKNKTKNELDFLIKHGIFMERQAEMVTDGIRALLLEYNSYHTKIFDFISDAHTPKNILIIGEKKKPITLQEQIKLREKIVSSKKYFGITSHHLEKALKF